MGDKMTAREKQLTDLLRRCLPYVEFGYVRYALIAELPEVDMLDGYTLIYNMYSLIDEIKRTIAEN